MSYKNAGIAGEEAVRAILRGLNGKIISGFIRSKNIKCNNSNFQIDFLVFAPKIGLVVVEVKNWKGTVKASKESQWSQEVGPFNNLYKNSSLQVLRTSSLLFQLLEKSRLNKWPIRPLVVFASEDEGFRLYRAKGSAAPQTDVIKKSMLKDWLEKNSQEAMTYHFNQCDFEKVKRIIAAHTQEFECAA